MIEVAGLKKSYWISGREKRILDGIDFSIPNKTFTTIFGPNGCGKTTLVNIIAGLDKNYTGTITGINAGKYEVGYVFQDYRRSLLPWYSVKENLLFPLSIRGLSNREKVEKLEKLLQITSLNLDLNQKVFSLSGGQAQAVGILRALIINPKLLILDEPFAAVDYEKTIELRRLLSDVAKAMNLTVLFISHDLEEAVILGDQIVFLSKHPTRVVNVLEIDLPYPPTFELTTGDRFNYLREKSLDIFKLSLKKRDQANFSL